MNTGKRIRPLMGIGDIFSIPRILFIPAFLISCALMPLIWIEGSLPKSNLLGAGFAALAFGGLTLFGIIIPAINALTLKRNGIDGTATIIKKEKRARTLITPDYNTVATATYVTFEFIPQGASTPLRLEAQAGKISSKLREGKTAKIRYAASNPRIMKFDGE